MYCILQDHSRSSSSTESRSKSIYEKKWAKFSRKGQKYRKNNSSACQTQRGPPYGIAYGKASTSSWPLSWTMLKTWRLVGADSSPLMLLRRSSPCAGDAADWIQEKKNGNKPKKAHVLVIASGTLYWDFNDFMNVASIMQCICGWHMHYYFPPNAKTI